MPEPTRPQRRNAADAHGNQPVAPLSDNTVTALRAAGRRRSGTRWAVAVTAMLGLAAVAPNARAPGRAGPVRPIHRPGPVEAPVADAAMRGDEVTLKKLLREGADVNAPQGDGMTALHWAARHDAADQVRMLVAAGARLESLTRNGAYTPLHVAAREGAAGAALALLEAGANAAAATTAGGATALHLAAGQGDSTVVAAMLARGVPVDVRDSAWSQTPLMWAAAAGRTDAVRVLLARGADLKLTSLVEDVPALEKADRAAAQARARRVAALRAAANPPNADSVRRAAAADSARKAAAADSAKAAEAAKAKEKGKDKGGKGNKAATGDNSAEAKQPDAARANSDSARRADRGMSYGELVGKKGGLTALLFAARQGHAETARVLLDAGADLNQPSAGDHTTPLLMAVLNGHFDLAGELLGRGADPKLASDAGATPLYGVLNVQWSAKALYPQPTAHLHQKLGYLDLMKALLDKGADPNARLTKHLWYASYNFDLLAVNTAGATPFWRAAYGTDVPAMKLLVKYGADPKIPTLKPAGRMRGEDADEEDDGKKDPSGLPEIPVGGPGVYPIHAASGVGYGEGYAANAHRHAPGGWMPAVKYLIEELGADVNARDHNGYNAVHHAAARGDNEMIQYLVSKGGDVTAVSRRGQTTADMANGPVQRIPPFLETVALLEKLGSKNSHKCKSC
ncbi:MAG: ankyrin repeat domain-containing protein [Gemmatimonadales bacterium]